jgi:outer membrane protein TolC
LPRDRAQIDAARGQATQAGMWNNPRFDTNNPQVFNGRTTLLNAGFQQEIPVMGKKRLDQAAANEIARQQEFNLFQDRYSLLTAIRQQFYQVLGDQRRVQVLTEMVEVLRSSYRTAEELKQAGNATDVDLLALRVDWQRALANLQRNQALLASDRKQLGNLVGIPGLVDRNVSENVSPAYYRFGHVFDVSARLGAVQRRLSGRAERSLGQRRAVGRLVAVGKVSLRTIDKPPRTKREEWNYETHELHEKKTK